MSKNLRSSLRWHFGYIRIGVIFGTLAGFLYATLEAWIDQVEFAIAVLVILRGIIIGFAIGISISFFEVATYYWQRRFSVWQLVLLKSLVFVVIINVWLLSINAISMHFEGTLIYFFEYLANSYLLNIGYSLLGVSIFLTAVQIGKLHRRNELWNYIQGRYHSPKHVKILLLSIDLKGSTTLAESMGDLHYAQFIKEYYADISECIFETRGDVYQYVGDEIIIYWNIGRDQIEKNERAIKCHELIQTLIKEREQYYLQKYGMVPSFRATVHAGNVAMTWVGDIKREVLFIGDVLNTSSRMQEICKRLGKDFLISGQALDVLPLTNKYLYPFEEKLIPRGKQKEILVFSVEPNQDIGAEGI